MHTSSYEYECKTYKKYDNMKIEFKNLSRAVSLFNSNIKRLY